MIYLDNAATSFPRPEQVYAEMDRANRSLSLNAGRGGYRAAREAAGMIEETRNMLADLLHCAGCADIVFTPSVTQALNQVLRGLDLAAGSVIYVSPYEHNAVARTVESIREKTGCEVRLLPLDDTMKMDLQKMDYLFHEKAPSAVVCTVISNVTGYRLPVEQIFAKAKEYGAVTIADAAQAAGLIPIDFSELHADVVCFAGHKTLCGPFGVGGFAIRKGLILEPVLTGGTGSDSLNLRMPQETPHRYEAGSENIVAVAGLRAALRWLKDYPHEDRIKELTERLISGLSALDKVTVLGTPSENPYGIVSFVVEGYESADVGMILDDEYDIAVRTGYHCAPYIHEYLQDIPYAGTVRAGIGPFNTKEDIDALVEAVESL